MSFFLCIDYMMHNSNTNLALDMVNCSLQAFQPSNPYSQLLALRHASSRHAVRLTEWNTLVHEVIGNVSNLHLIILLEKIYWTSRVTLRLS